MDSDRFNDLQVNFKWPLWDFDRIFTSKFTPNVFSYKKAVDL